MTYSMKLWSEILQIISGKKQTAVEDPNGPYPIYGSGGTIGFAHDYLCEAGTTIIGRKGTINNPIFVNERFWNVDTAFGLAPGDMLHPKYLYYFCVMFNFKELDKSTTIPSLAKRDLLNIRMPVPPLPEQERIVANIEELFSELDKAVETLRTTKQHLAMYRQAVLKEAFGKVTTHTPFGKIIDARLGKMLDKKKNTGNYKKYLRNINVRWFSFDLSDLLEMRIEDGEIEKYSVSLNDLIICEGGEPGRCAVWDKQDSLFYQKALHRVRFLDNSNPKFYMYYLWFFAQAGQLCRYFTGTGIKHLTGQSLSKVIVPTADRTIQDSIVAEIESRLSVCDSIEKTMDTALQQAEALRQSILKKAFEGGTGMTTDLNLYRELDTNIKPRNFEIFCMETLKSYAEQEHLQNFKIAHDQKVETDDGTYQIDVLAEYTALGVKNTVIIECKKQSRSVEREIVAALDRKLQSIGAQKGILISTAGFQSGAVKFAEKHGIALWQVCDNYIRGYSNAAGPDCSEARKFQMLAEQYLPKYFMMEWDCTADYPYNQIYPTEEMYIAARKQARENYHV